VNDNIIEIKLKTKVVESFIATMLRNLPNVKKLLRLVLNHVKAQTREMFRKRPDKRNVRGVRWPENAQSTVDRKKALMKVGKAIASRPMIETGEGRDSLRVLRESKTGFVFGTDKKRKDGFAYLAHHNSGKYPFIFLNDEDKAKFEVLLIDHLKNCMK